METRPITLDISALSPTEYQAYHPFITQFNHHTQNTHGKLRFAQAAEFLRRYYRFQTEREDEIRSFFPQEIQLGQIDLGSILAILRLLAHLHHHQPTTTTLKLTHHLVFIQTQPIPSTSSSNPFRPTTQNYSLNSATPSPPYCFPQSLSANELPSTRLPSSSSNPFKQRSLSAATSNNQQSSHFRPASPESQHHHHLPSPKIPPRPTRLSKLNTANLSTPSSSSPSSEENRIHKSAPSLIGPSSDIKPPPKHYSQRSKTLDPSLDHFHPFDPPPPPSSSKNPTTTLSSEVHLLHLSPSKLNRPRFIDHQHAQNIQNGSPDSKPTIPPPLPPPIPTKPIRAQNTEGPRATKARPEKPAHLSSTLHRSQTFNDHHQSRRNWKVPALPSEEPEQEKKQRRPESLHETLHNPFAVSLDELVGSFGNAKESGPAPLSTHQERADSSHQDWDPKPGLQNQRAHKSPESRRSVSLFFHQDHPHQHSNHPHPHPHSHPKNSNQHLHWNKNLHQNFKDFEKEIKLDSKLIVDELVVGWTSRFGIKDERAPLVDKS